MVDDSRRGWLMMVREVMEAVKNSKDILMILKFNKFLKKLIKDINDC